MAYYIVYDVFVSVLCLRSNELHVYAAIYSAVAHMKGYISITQITKQTGVSRSAVCKIVKSLEGRGMITRIPDGRRRKNRYILQRIIVAKNGMPVIPNTTEQMHQSEKTSVKSTHCKKKDEQNYGYIQTSTGFKPLL